MCPGFNFWVAAIIKILGIDLILSFDIIQINDYLKIFEE